MKAIVQELQRNYKKPQPESGVQNVQQQPGPASSGGEQPQAQPMVSLPSLADVQPSSQWADYRNAAYSIQYPENWRPTGGTADFGVTIAPEQGIAGTGTGSQVIYGVVAGFRAVAGGFDLASESTKLIGEFQKSNPSMQVSGSARRYQLSGSQALITTIYQSSVVANQREVNLLVTAERPQGLFYVVFVAPEQTFMEMQPTYEKILRSIQFPQ